MKPLSFIQKIGLSILSGLILTLSWPFTGSLVVTIFFGFVPLFFLEKSIIGKRYLSAVFRFAFLAFLIWNIGVTWFIFMIQTPGATAGQELMSKLAASGLAYVFNSAFMAIVFMLYSWTRRRNSERLGYLGLIVFWLSFEYVHMHWDINWPWLNLGNVFATNPRAVQWYEYIGSPGGSLWVLVVNILIYRILKAYLATKKWSVRLTFRAVQVLIVILIPTWISYSMYSNYQENGQSFKAIVAQPNIDPYNEKFNTDPIVQFESMLELSEEYMDDQVQLLLFPETAIQERARVYKKPTGELFFTGPWEGKYAESKINLLLQPWLKKHPQLTLISGVSDRKPFLNPNEKSPTARYIEKLDLYYDSYNSLLRFQYDSPITFYRKSKLVPGVESIPFGTVLNKLEGFALDLGGASGSLGIQDEPTNLMVDSIAVGGMVCYESVFGEYVTGYTKKGAQILAISTNDSWWGDSPGYKQLLAYARLRAIENRRSVVRSANSGISCFINQRGDIVSKTGWWEKTALKDTVTTNDEITFYVQHGDFLSRISSFMFVILILYNIVRGKLKR